MARPTRMTSRDAVLIDGLDEFRRELNKLRREHGIDGRKALKTTNNKVAQLIVDRASAKAKGMGGREALAASTMKAAKDQTGAVIRAGGNKTSDRAGQMFGGSEFGAYRNRRRLKKNTGGRNTIVRDNEDITKVIRRVEAQTVTANKRGGYTTLPKRARRLGAQAVKVTGIVIGWNQFRDWRGNKSKAGYFLYPTIRSSTDDAVALYATEMEEQLKSVFPH